jgi:hypothetical protein
MGLVLLHGENLALFYLLAYALAIAAWFGICYLIIKLLDRKKK